MHLLFSYLFLSCLSLILFLYLFKGFKVVPQQQVWIVERFGKYIRKLEPGLNWTSPMVDIIAYRHSMKEDAIEIHEQTAITQDNVSVTLDGVLYMKVIDPIKASYGVENAHYALKQLVQTTMRSEIGKIPLDKCFEGRELLNTNIVTAINEAVKAWGIQCLRYEIKDINIPEEIRKAMELQMTAERQKRARILESEGLRQSEINRSEGERQSKINVAEGIKRKMVLESEASRIDQINRSKGEAEALLTIAAATADGIKIIASSLESKGGEKAAALKTAEQYIEAFKELAKEGTTIFMPQDASDAGSMVAKALTIFDSVSSKKELKKDSFLTKVSK